MRFTLSPGPPVTFKARLHDARTATAIGRRLGLAMAICFATGVLSHYLQHPPGWLADSLPSRPYWGYRLTQGLHVASGIAAIPLLLAKLWAVYPRLFAWPPVRSVLHALERISVAVLVAAGLFELFTGLLNTFQWYPWPFDFVPVHYAVAWLLLGSLLLHVAVQWPKIRDHFTRRSPGTRALPEAEGPDRRQLLLGVTAAVGAVTLTTVGQSVTSFGTLELFGPRSPAHGVQGLPVNRTAAAARVAEASLEDWRLTVDGPRPYTLTLEQVRALDRGTGAGPPGAGGWRPGGAGPSGFPGSGGSLPGDGDGTSLRTGPAHVAGTAVERRGAVIGPRLPGADHRPEPARCPADQVGRPTGGRVMSFRHVVGGFGLMCATWGGWLLLQQPELWRIAVWLGGAVVVHDGFVAPLVMAIAALLADAGLRLRGVVRGALTVGGSLTAIALPPLLRPAGVANPTVLPLDYLRNWLLAMAAIASLTLAYVGARAVMRRASRRA